MQARWFKKQRWTRASG